MADDKSLVTLLQEKEEQIRTVIPTWIDRDRFMAATYELRTQWLKDDNLKKCTNESLVNCVYESARTGLEFAAKHAYVVAYGTEATFMPGYRGKIYLKLRSGAVKSIVADIVYDNDEFYVERNSDDPAMMRLVHRYAKGPRGKPIASYAMAKLANDIVDFEVCYKERVDRSRAKSKQPNGLMWGTFWEEAWKKTAVHLLDKRLPEGVDPEAIKAYRLAQLLEATHQPEPEDAELSEDETPRARDTSRGEAASPASEPARAVQEVQPVPGANPGPDSKESRIHTVLEAIEEVDGTICWVCRQAAAETVSDFAGPTYGTCAKHQGQEPPDFKARCEKALRAKAKKIQSHDEDRHLTADEDRKVAEWVKQRTNDPMLLVRVYQRFHIMDSFCDLKVSQLDDFKAAIEGR